MLNNLQVACGRKCFNNFRADNLNDTENICMSNCINKYYDVYESGNQLMRLIGNGEIKLNLSANNNVSMIVDQMNSKINI